MINSIEGELMANSDPGGRLLQIVADGSPCLPGDGDIVVAASRAIPPDEVDEWPECPGTGPEPTTAVAAVELTIPTPEAPTPKASCPPNDWGPGCRMAAPQPEVAQGSAGGLYAHQRPQ